jgi:hypothetical protein
MLRILLKCSGQRKWTGGFVLNNAHLYIPALAVSIYVKRQAISGFVDLNIDMVLNNGGLEGGIGSQ